MTVRLERQIVYILFLNRHLYSFHLLKTYAVRSVLLELSHTTEVYGAFLEKHSGNESLSRRK